MKYIMTLAFLIIALFSVQAQVFSTPNSQIADPITWDAKLEQKNDSIYNLIFTARLEKGWHLYSQEVDEDGPIPTTFTFNSSANTYELIGNTKEPDVPAIYDEVFGMDIKFFDKEAVFIQEIKVFDKDANIEVEVEFMVCDDEQCLPPDIAPFQFSVNEKKAIKGYADADVTSLDIEKTKALDIEMQGWENYQPEKEEGSTYWNIFFLGFIGGLIALLTPCVFPMIPLTVSFFTKGARTRKKGLVNAILYGVFIFLIYLLLSLPFHLLDSVAPEILNNISTNVTLNIVFFVIFIFFAFSFFGYYEITLPTSWSSKMDDKASSVGGIVGIFFMALTLALVSFSCTGPILGSLLGGSLSSDGGAIQLSFGMGGFGLALALPFALFALFPNWLSSLPKSGGWLNTVKVVLGFIELGLAFKFLSNADLVQHWGLLKREIFIGIWIIVGIGLTLYLFGLIRFPHDGPKKKLSKTRFAFGSLSFLFVLYLFPGLTNTPFANLKLLSGFPPPLFYSVYEKETEGPLGLKAYKSWEEGLAVSKAQNKPIMLDFTGWACVNCRKMEEQVWSNPEVYDMINNKYILISLYVDDKMELSEQDKFNYVRENGGIKKIRTVGDKWATFQTVNFRNNSQPFYVLLDPNVKILNQPVGYTPNEEEYLDWLKDGLTKFKTASAE
ncbi:protein-disulfide reductase DsbD family protein [Gillisia limnaea]|uniref:Cytochrome c biogenesis protein transmembrane region n=1 Tax=Gillisia limnaea (strain DSM 15749 / LMG 21470 / R-8282) TaxID=865937 RepID=H2BRD5_GILLR|nr:thioredoxin family protein [Gillisia limnaea]EHQ04454.1 cytochrome c biogenesis protein transmembrane region [Gillisia limnaea DSM 15749]